MEITDVDYNPETSNTNLHIKHKNQKYILPKEVEHLFPEQHLNDFKDFLNRGMHAKYNRLSKSITDKDDLQSQLVKEANTDLDFSSTNLFNSYLKSAIAAVHYDRLPDDEKIIAKLKGQAPFLRR